MSETLIHVRKTCRCCGSLNIELSVPLAKIPIVSPNVGIDEKNITKLVAPLDNYLCLDCGLIQLVHVVEPALIYRNYLYRTSISKGLAEHFKGMCNDVLSRHSMSNDSFVVEFGSNDGTLLRHFKDVGMRVQGVDPAEEIAKEASSNGIPTYADFFGPDVAKKIIEGQKKADLILSNNVMANIDDLSPIIDGIKTLMADDGAYVFETQYALDVFERFLLDVIYHEHISCFSVQPVVKAFKKFGLEVFDAERISTKGGSIRFWIQHKNGPRPIADRVDSLIALENETGLYDLAYHKKFSNKVTRLKRNIHSEISTIRAKGGSVAVWGTSVGCAALIHQFELEDKIDFFLDDTPLKDRLEGPGYNLPVFKGDGVMREKPDLIIILAWRYAHLIMPKHQNFMDAGGRFLIPLPDISIVP